MAGELQVAGSSKLPDVVRSHRDGIQLEPLPPLHHDLRPSAWIGIATVIVFFVIGGGWAATAPLSGAIIAGGLVSPESSRQTVQHLEGGIIREIRVREGDKVEAGQPLVTLQDVSAKSDLGTLTTRLRALAATEARLRAERLDGEAINFDHPSLADRKDPEVRAAIEQQIHQFKTRRANDQSQASILIQRIAQLQKQIDGAEQQLVGVRRQKDLIREELRGVKELFEKGYERKPRLLELQRTEAGLLGTEGELQSRVARSLEQIGETRLEINNIRVTRMEEVDKELTDVLAKRNEIEQQIQQSQDRLTRTQIVAPVAGTVLDIRYKTPGGVIRPGDPVLDIVPAKDKLIVDAVLKPQDIDEVRPKMRGYVVFPAYSQRTMMRVPAIVETVSADVLTDQRSGERHYKVKIAIDRDELTRLDPQIELVAGMPAEVYITTTERTLLQYVLKPFLQVVEHSIRES